METSITKATSNSKKVTSCDAIILRLLVIPRGEDACHRAQPDQRMHLVRHYNEADALRLLSLMIEDAEQYHLGVAEIKQPTFPETLKPDEVDVLLIVGNRPFFCSWAWGLIHNRGAVFACKQDRETTRAACLGSDALTAACLLCFAHRLQATGVTLHSLKSTGVTRV